MAKFQLLVFVFLLHTVSYAQKYELGRVSAAELAEKRNAIDTTAPAAVLYNKGRTYFTYKPGNFSVVHEFEIRIKIYKKEGLQYANYEVPYYIGYENLNKDVLSVSDAVTYNLVDGKIEKTKLTGDGTFREKVNKNWKTVTIALPNVKVGSVIEFKYKLRSENIVSFPNFRFQREIPVNYVMYKTEVPGFFFYKTLVNGLLKVTSESKVTDGFQNYTNEHNQSEDLTYKQIVSTHELKDIPPLKQENYVDNIDNYRASIDHELEVIRYPNEPEKNLAQTWEGLAKTIYEDNDFGKQLKLRGYFEGDLRQLLQGKETRAEKISAIFNFAKAKMSWNNEYGIFTDVGVEKAYLNRTGNIAEVNFILIAMLNAAGIITSPVLISTVGNGIAAFPNRTAFNYVVAAVVQDGSQILLDAANKYTVPGILPRYALNWSGRLINIDGSSQEINLQPETASKTTVNVIAAIDRTGLVTGKVRSVKADYEAFSFREKYEGIDRENYLEKLEDNLNRISISNYQIENEKASANPVQETYDFSSDNHVEIIDGKMYINPMLFFASPKNPFISDDRKLPIYFGYPKTVKYTLSIQLPEGYTIESIPQSLSVATGENVGAFKYNIQASADKFQIVVSSEINKMLVAAEFYPVLKDYFRQIAEKQNERIVLKKI